ncbi:hypothetical protein A3C59_03225 [Candidatus Daviesbacteria bacterium RIFCSPHIGHO2_02_FULL_36_13]|uniref:Serine aminopeptidase S33 domain-containing protein n=1 Tax=Candidatus Daviesbacteria bacterium RIFCSPHIGHO2_02_FULL_36_13 TaxID=1797768 RepID=A0A1F5JPT5_9BACT|nr:MAG: hypothetical protein A3C59_03225 [Candidatus Daviesbacteria bacterium RIFCSPHIGHO2_02_FULL_36_13]OGE43229.1 MAG: hypothetical protein A3A45_03170 [Candidatus Daviesbacteria bacterium RIFCSPLOWO2_01_FULL_36_8]
MKILVLHGWTYSTEKWDPFMDIISSKTDVELLKIPGLTEKLEAVWNLDNYVEWLKTKIGDSKVILIGHSNGGRISLAFANKYPEKVSKLILIDSAGIYHNELPIRLKRLVFKIIAKLGKKIINSEKLRKILYKLSREGDYENASPTVKKTMLNLITTDISFLLPEIKIPTLIIWGENDNTTPLKDGALMHKLIRGSKLKIISGARHSPQFTHPKEVAKIIYKNLLIAEP